MSSKTHDWDAETYHRVADPQEQWGREVLGRLELGGDELVLDAGCGTGRVTRLLAERVPRGRVIAVDASPAMVESARANLGPEIDVRCQDLLELSLEQAVDVVFSTAVFHHIHDHERLFASVRGVLRPGGRLVAQCGGHGNIERFLRATEVVASGQPYREYLAGLTTPWYFATAADTERRLRGAGFASVRCWLEPKPTTPADPLGFAAAATLNYHLECLPPELADPFVADVIAAGGEPPVIDYVRLNIEAA